MFSLIVFFLNNKKVLIFTLMVLACGIAAHDPGQWVITVSDVGLNGPMLSVAETNGII